MESEHKMIGWHEHNMNIFNSICDKLGIDKTVALSGYQIDSISAGAQWSWQNRPCEQNSIIGLA